MKNIKQFIITYRNNIISIGIVIIISVIILGEEMFTKNVVDTVNNYNY